MNTDDPRAIAFKSAVESGDAERLRVLFREHSALTDVIDAPWFSFDKPALVEAASRHNRPLIDALLELGADIDARSGWPAGPYSALHSLVDGATRESLALADYLASRGANVDIHAAAGMGRISRIAEILDESPDVVSAPGPDGATPLHLARTPEVAEYLLSRGAEIDKRCVDHKSTPSMWAAQGREHVMRLLLARGATPDLYQAALLDDVELAAAILDRDPEAIDVRVRFGQSHPHLGGGDKYVWALEGADTPLEVARRRGSEAVYDLLLARSGPRAQMVQAARRGDGESLSAILVAAPHLLESLADETICDALVSSPVATKLLLEAGADPNARDDQTSATALHHAAWRGLDEVASLLLRGGADPSIRDRAYGATPLGWANENNQAAIMELILSHAPPDIVDASWLGMADRVSEILSENPGVVDGFDDGGISPLRSAAWCGKIEVVRVLLAHGADPSIPHPESGKTAAEYAAAQGHTDIVSLLSRY